MARGSYSLAAYTLRILLALACLLGTAASAAQAQTSLPASCTSFTDHPIVPGATTIKAIHLGQLRACNADLRVARGLPPVSWMDPVLAPQQTVVRAVHFSELRAALDSVYVAAGSSPPQYSETPVAT